MLISTKHSRYKKKLSNHTNFEALKDDSEAFNDLPKVLGDLDRYPHCIILSLHCLYYNNCLVQTLLFLKRLNLEIQLGN